MPFYVGEPAHDEHPLAQQDRWLQRHEEIAVPETLMKPMGDLRRLAIEGNRPFVELVMIAMDEKDPPGPTGDDDPDDGDGDDGPSGSGTDG